MPHDDRDVACLWDMVNAARGVLRVVKNADYKRYIGDEDIRHIVERRIEIIGEAAKRISPIFRDSHPEIPWRSIIAQRNVLSHEYDEIDHERIWRLAVEQIPILLDKLEPLLPAPPDEKND